MTDKIDLKQRIFGLDLLRAFAILFVVFSHLPYVSNSYNATFQSLCGIFGYLGVEIFFVLSGFLIGTILLRNYLSDFGWKEIKTFLKRRWFRTLPAYYLVLLLNFGIAFLFGYEIVNGWKYFFFLQNFSFYEISIFKESWSLSIEEWTYLLMPFVLLFTFRFTKWSKKSSFFITITILILIFHLLRFYAYTTLQVFEMEVWNTEIKSVVIYRIDAILMGFVVAWLHHYYSKYLIQYRVYAVIIAAHLFFFQFVVLNVLGVTLVTNPIYYKVFYFTFSSFMVAISLPFFIYWKKTFPLFQKLIEFISKISYSMYLLHYSIIAVFFRYGVSFINPPISIMLSILMYFGSTVVLSYFLYRFFEKPIMDLRDKV